jgi:hypothetical protein
MTVAIAFSRRGNLMRLLSSDQCPAALKEAWQSVRPELDLGHLDRSAIPDGSHTQGIAIKETISNLGYLDDATNWALTLLLGKNIGSRPQVFLHHHCELGGVSYSDYRGSFRHSIIYFYSGGRDAAHLKPAQISAIFSRRDRDNTNQLIHRIYFAIHEYLPSDINPFATFHDFRAHLSAY